jgi:hypothetical protein
VRVELLARDVLHRAVGVLGLGVADDDRHLGQPERPRSRDPMEARDELEGLAVAAHDDRDEHALQRDRSGQRLDVRLVERAHVVRDADLLERDLAAGFLGDCGHVVLLLMVARPAGAPIPATRTPARACHPRVTIPRTRGFMPSPRGRSDGRRSADAGRSASRQRA